MKKITSPRKKTKVKDSRWWCGDERLHPLIGHALAIGACTVRQTSDDFKFLNEEFSRAALPILEDAGAVVLVTPTVRIPDWLPEREQKLARRHITIPIWMPTGMARGGAFDDYLSRLLDVIEEALRKVKAT